MYGMMRSPTGDAHYPPSCARQLGDMPLQADDIVYVPFSYLRNFGMQDSGGCCLPVLKKDADDGEQG